jgi:hypothetical protein
MNENKDFKILVVVMLVISAIKVLAFSSGEYTSFSETFFNGLFFFIIYFFAVILVSVPIAMLLGIEIKTPKMISSVGLQIIVAISLSVGMFFISNQEQKKDVFMRDCISDPEFYEVASATSSAVYIYDKCEDRYNEPSDYDPN